MAKTNKMDAFLCNLADAVVANGASLAIWGDKEIPESLREMYKKEQVEKDYESK